MLKKLEPKWKDIMWKAFVAVSIVVAIIPMVFCTLRIPLSPDPAYFLSIVERMAEGRTLYSDVHSGYTPLWSCLMLGWKRLFHIPVGCFEAYYPFHFLMHLFSAFCLYKCIQCIGINGKIAYFCSWLFLMMNHWMDGNQLILEPSTVMFGVFAMWLVLCAKGNRWLLFVGGFAAACSFLCKQYGLGFFVLLLLPVIYRNKRWTSGVLVYVSGFLIPLLICYAIWGDQIVKQTLMNGYGTSINEANGIGINEKLGWIAYSTKVLMKRCAIALPASLLFVPVFIREKKLPIVVFCWLGIGGFLLTNYFASFGFRYLLLTTPFVAILCALSLSFMGKAKILLKYVFLVCLAFTTAYTLHCDYRNKIWRGYMHPEYKQGQKALAEEVKKRVGENDLLWIPDGGLNFVYYFANRLPPNLSTISYAFGQGMTHETAWKQVEAADFVLSFDRDDLETYFDKEMKDFVYSHVAVYADKGKEATLHDMSRLKVER